MAPAYRDRYQLLKNTDDDRNKLIEELLLAHDGLKGELEKARDRLERDSDTAELYQQRSKEAIAKVEALQKLSNSSTYMCVLIDGEEICFRDQFVKGKALEGQEAASTLRMAIKEYINGLGIHQDCDIVLYIYVNAYAFSRRYHVNHSDVDRFISDFNTPFSLFNLVDGGNDPSVTRNKIGELFRLHVNNLHCKHVIIGATTGQKIARTLETCVGDRDLEARITLVQGPSLSEELSTLSTRFKNTSFSQVFRNSTTQPLNISTPSRPTSPTYADIAKHKSPEDKFLESLEVKRRHSTNSVADYNSEQQGAGSRDRRPSLRETAEIKVHNDNDFGAKSRRPDTDRIAYPPAYFMDAPFGFIARNHRSERVDVPLTKPDKDVIYEIKNRKVCNDFVFRKNCPIYRCRHEHAKGLNDKEFHALRDVARTFPCQAGLSCKDPLCHAGHRCPVDPCGYVYGSSCRYPPDLHDIDTKIVNKDDLEKFERDSYDETRILGVTSRPKRDPVNATAVSRSGDPIFRNLSVAFENGVRNGTKNPNFSPPQPHALGNSILHAPKIATQAPASTVPVTTDPVSPLKRTADELEDLHYQPNISSSPARDPRVGAQKRLRASGSLET